MTRLDRRALPVTRLDRRARPVTRLDRRALPVTRLDRRARPVTPLALAVLVACSTDSGDPSCGPRHAVVERVIDGDTIVLPGDVRIRYLLVDAPELTGGHAACYGASAAQFNADLVLGKAIELTYDTRCQDRFGRTLAYVTVDGQDVNRLLVERGYACVLHIPPDGDARAGELDAVQAAARAAGRGLWSACAAVPCDASGL